MKKITLLFIKIVIFAAFIYLAWRYFDGPAFVDGWKALADAPLWLALMTAAYSAAFFCRAAAWRLYLPEAERPTLALCWHGLIYSLLLNHVLPVKAGDAARVGVLWRHGTPAALALHSVAAARALDMAALTALAAAGAPLLLGADDWAGPVYAAAGLAAAAAAAGALPLARRLPWRAVRRHADIAANALRGVRGVSIAALTLAGWLLEAAVVFAVAAAAAAHGELRLPEAVWANAFTIAGGLFYAGPGGIGGYESVMSFALERTGMTWSDALNVALISHSFKFLYSYAAGLITWLAMPIGKKDWKEWRGMTAAVKQDENRKGAVTP
ncbi:lysylphosphatidylglycerol synthase domain-containing protein [Paenibacillus thermotolerans]|uniref:lysylphosphatidylglycerol synthase domain-containing protein n=1 Tax=Paenibacillus thermotolerans TaxID=3027807 RepID=UPI002368D228|nr:MULTISPECIES: lysylphosphatidylglycerol synthase domain-containing protein [unclassified Paenibacillus]